MGFKVMIFLLASFLLVTTKVSSDEESFWDAFYAKVPVKAPTLPVKPPAKAPTLPVKPPAKVPTLPVKPPAKAPVKAPSPAPVKAPAPPIKLLPPVSIKECPTLCRGRCKLHSRIRHCTRVCVTCCQRCKCVPPGTYGNKEMCGKCYTEMTTHGNRPKCP